MGGGGGGCVGVSHAYICSYALMCGVSHACLHMHTHAHTCLHVL